MKRFSPLEGGTAFGAVRGAGHDVEWAVTVVAFAVDRGDACAAWIARFVSVCASAIGSNVLCRGSAYL